MVDEMTSQNNDAQATEGKAAVRRLFVQRVEDAGLLPAKGVTPAAHGAMMARLVDYLSYMSPDNLMTLAELVMGNAEGAKGTLCPSELVIKGFAKSLQPRPLAEHRIVTSWLACIEGPKAEMGGYLVELMRWLRRHGRKPLGYDVRQMQQLAAENQRAMFLIAGRIERGVATPEDHSFAQAYGDDLTRATEIVAAGRAARLAAEKGQAA